MNLAGSSGGQFRPDEPALVDALWVRPLALRARVMLTAHG